MTETLEAVEGLSTKPVSALRYNGRVNHRRENTGILISFLKDGERLLDIGCGTGSITRVLRDARSLSVVGLKPHSERAEQAQKRRVRINSWIVRCKKSSRFGLVDSVLFADVLEYLIDLLQIPREIDK